MLALALAGCLFLPSCATDGVDSSSTSIKTRKRDKQVIAMSEAAGYGALEDRFAFDTRSLKRDKNGNFVGAVRSQFDGQRNVSFGGAGVGTKGYQAGQYKAGTWNGTTKARASDKAYTSRVEDARFKQRSQFQGVSPSHLASQSRFNGQSVSKDSYRAAAAREANGRSIAKPTDGWTDFRRRVYPEPDVMSRADYERLNIEQTRKILGRDE